MIDAICSDKRWPSLPFIVVAAKRGLTRVRYVPDSELAQIKHLTKKMGAKELKIEAEDPLSHLRQELLTLADGKKEESE